MTTTYRAVWAVAGLGLVVFALNGCSGSYSGSGASALTAAVDGGGGSATNRATSSTNSGPVCSFDPVESGAPNSENNVRIDTMCTANLANSETGGVRPPTQGGVTSGSGTNNTPIPPGISCELPGAGVAELNPGGSYSFRFRLDGSLGFYPVVTFMRYDAVRGTPVVSSTAAGHHGIVAEAGRITVNFNAAQALAEQNYTFAFRVAYAASGVPPAFCWGHISQPIPTPTAAPIPQPMQLACASQQTDLQAGRSTVVSWNHVGGDASANISYVVNPSTGSIAAGAGISATYTAPGEIPVGEVVRVVPIVDGVAKDAAACTVALKESFPDITPPTVARCGGEGGISQFVLAAQDGSSVQLSSWPLNPNYDVASLSPELGTIAEVAGQPSVWRYSLAQLPANQTEVVVSFHDQAGRATNCSILVPQRGQIGYGTDGGTTTTTGTGTGTGTDQGTGDATGDATTGPGTGTGYEVQGIVGNVYDTPVNANRLMTESELPAPFTQLLVANFDRPNWRFENGFPGVPNHVEWFQMSFGGPSKTYASSHDYDLSKIIKMKLNFPVAGKYRFWLTSDDGAILYVADPEDENLCYPNGETRAGAQCTKHADYAQSRMKLIVNNDGLHAVETRNAPFIAKSAGQRQLQVDYYQGPRYYIALQLHWALEKVLNSDGSYTACSAVRSQVEALGLSCSQTIVGPQFFSTEVGYH